MAGLNKEYFNCVQLNITNLVNILYTMTQTYRLLVGGAEEFARIGLAPKHDKEEAIDRADDMGDIIDKVIKKLDSQTTIFLQLFEPEIICALPNACTCIPRPTTTPCPTATPCPTTTPTPTVTQTSPTTDVPTSESTKTAEIIIEVVNVERDNRVVNGLSKKHRKRKNSKGSNHEEEKKDEDN